MLWNPSAPATKNDSPFLSFTNIGDPQRRHSPAGWLRERLMFAGTGETSPAARASQLPRPNGFGGLAGNGNHRPSRVVEHILETIIVRDQRDLKPHGQRQDIKIDIRERRGRSPVSPAAVLAATIHSGEASIQRRSAASTINSRASLNRPNSRRCEGEQTLLLVRLACGQ